MKMNVLEKLAESICHSLAYLIFSQLYVIMILGGK